MPKLKFALEKGGPKRLEISYGWGGMKNLKIRLDGSEVGVIPTKQELEQGRTFRLFDGSSLSVQLTKNLLSSGLNVLRDGWPVPGSNNDPFQRLANAYGALFFVAAVNIFLGLGAILFRIDFLQEIGLGWFSVIFGVVMLLLGFGVRARSRAALGIALGLLAIDMVLTIFVALTSGVGTPYFSGLFVRIVILWALYRGLDAIRMLEEGPPTNRGKSSVLSGLPSISDPLPSIGKSSSIIVEDRQSWSSLEKGLIGIVVVLIVVVGGLVLSRAMPASSVPVTIGVLPTVQMLPTARAMPTVAATQVVSDSPGELVLNIPAQSPTSPMNLPPSPSDTPQYAGDLAWNMPAFASSFYVDGYPSGATGDPGGWRTASSDGTWFYVDLGEPQTIHEIVVTLFVDSAFTDAPVTQYIVSNDLQTWQVVVTDVNTENVSGRFQPRLLTLPEDVSARYVGLYAQNWGGGWGGAEQFAVFSPEHPYTPISQ